MGTSNAKFKAVLVVKKQGCTTQSSIASLVLASSTVDKGALGLRWILARNMFLVLIDSHLKWIEVEPVESATTKTKVRKLRKIFSTHGIPEKLVSDNGSAFTSQEFTDFVKSNGIDHIKTTPYHPSSNGLVERAVQVLKKGLSLVSVVQVQDYTAIHDRNITCRIIY